MFLLATITSTVQEKFSNLGNHRNDQAQAINSRDNHQQNFDSFVNWSVLDFTITKDDYPKAKYPKDAKRINKHSFFIGGRCYWHK
jgi:hypothetical protein